MANQSRVITNVIQMNLKRCYNVLLVLAFAQATKYKMGLNMDFFFKQEKQAERFNLGYIKEHRGY